MAAKALQQGGAALQQLEQVHAPPGPAGAFPHALVQADHKGGAGELLGQAGGHDAHHPLVPLLVGQDDGPGLGLLRQALDALLKDVPLDGLALPVQVAQGLGQRLRPVRVLGEQQLQGHLRPAQPPGGVDPGGQGIAHGDRGHGPLRKARAFDQLGKAQPPGRVQVVQSLADDGPVLSRHGHHVGHRAHGGQVPILPEHGPGFLRSRHRHGQL